MELKFLEEFILLSELKNYREVAKRLEISSSALTKHIVVLENELHFPLFERTTRKVELSEYGETFLPYARKIVQIKENGCAALGKLQNHTNTNLTIGADAITSQLGISDALAQYKSANPNCSINVVGAPPHELEIMLKNGTCDLVLLRQEASETKTFPEFNCQVYAKEQLVALLPPQHPLSQRDTIKIEELKQDNFIFYPKNSGIYERALAVCHDAGFEPNVVMTNISAINCARLVSQNVGIALIPMQIPFVRVFKNTSVVPIVPPTLFHINILYPAEREFVTPAATRFLEYITNTNTNS